MVYRVTLLFIICLIQIKEIIVVIAMGRKEKEMGADAKNVIVDLIQNGLSRRKISELLKIQKSTVIDFRQKFSDMGSLDNKPKRGKPPKIKP